MHTEPTPIYTTIAHADVTEDGRVWRYSVVIRYVAAWREEWPEECHEDHDAENDLYLYRHPANEALRPENYHPRTASVWIDCPEGQAVAGNIRPAAWEELVTSASRVWPNWPTFAEEALYPQRVRVIGRLMQEAGVP